LTENELQIALVGDKIIQLGSAENPDRDELIIKHGGAERPRRTRKRRGCSACTPVSTRRRSHRRGFKLAEHQRGLRQPLRRAQQSLFGMSAKLTPSRRGARS
jgi:hypothetical protein